MKKTYIIAAILLILTVAFSGCAKNDSDVSSSSPDKTEEQSSSLESESPENQRVVVNVFVPSSMTLSMNDLIETYKTEGAGGTIVANYSDSVSLGRQIENHADCDIFICEDSTVLDQLMEGQYLKTESRAPFSDKEIVLIVSEDKEVTPEAQAFYEFLLSEQAQAVMSESLDGAVTFDGQEGNS